MDAEHAELATFEADSVPPVVRGPGRLYHALILAAAMAVPAFGLSMTRLSDERVAFAGFESLPLPTLCVSRQLGIECATCGMTRSVIALMHGEFADSVSLHRLGWLVLLVIVLQIPYRAIRLWNPQRRLPRLEFWGIALLIATGVLLVANRFGAALGLL